MKKKRAFTKEDAMQSRIHQRRMLSITDYRRATGFEALMGYLYLSGRYSRMMELIKAALTEYGEIKK